LPSPLSIGVEFADVSRKEGDAFEAEMVERRDTFDEAEQFFSGRNADAAQAHVNFGQDGEAHASFPRRLRKS
jgi:hypothetical protein